MDHPDQVAALVARTELCEASAPVPLAAGAWSTAYALTVAGEPMVLRVGRHSADFAKDAVVAAVARGTLPVPAVTARGEASGWAYAVSERATGTPIDDLDADGLAAALPALFEIMDAIGRIDVGGRGYGQWEPDRVAPYRSWPEALLAIEWEKPRVPGWRSALAASPIGMEPFERALHTLRRLAPDLPDERRMVHDDLLAGNVLVEGDRITAVLDWGNASFGDPLYDAAWLLYFWPWYPQWSTIDIDAAIRRRWRPDPVALRSYQIHIGLDAMAYCASRNRFEDVARNAEALLRLA